MLTILKKIFGSEKVISAGISGIDKLAYTPEEKADYHLKFLNAYGPFKLAQRYLAIMFSAVFLFVFLMASVLMVVGGIIDQQLLIITADRLIVLTTEMLGWIILTIIGFYFAGGTVNSFRQMKKRKESSKN